MRTSTQPTRVLFAGFHPLILDDVRPAFADGFAIADSTADETTLFDVARHQQPHFIVIDLMRLSSMKTIERLASRFPTSRVVAVTGLPSSQIADAVFSAGASGTVFRLTLPVELPLAIQSIREGRPYCSRTLLLKHGEMRPASSLRAAELAHNHQLLLRLIAKGKPIAEMAEALGLSVRTVRLSMAYLMRRFRIRTAEELRRYALEQRLPPRG